jgi:N-acetylglucosaminyldiphosphoundecaprenol N-acetyl-beta-D-mannosaminyltransferase
MPVTKILGINYNNVTIKEAAEELLVLATGHKARYVVTPNPEISESCRKDQMLKEAVLNADYVVPDGIGVIMASKILGRPLRERVGGYDLACALLPMIEAQGLSLCLLGAKPGVAEIAAERIQADYPLIKAEIAHHGYFSDDGDIISKINVIKPDVLFVALGSPRQEIWMFKNRQKIDAGIMLGLGGSLDVLAGSVKRAPKIFIKLNLEWFYRLLCQPSRLVRMFKLPKYLFRAIFTRIFKRNKEV